MSNITVNITTAEISTNSTAASTLLVDPLQVLFYCILFFLGFPAYSYVLWLIITGTENRLALEFFNLNVLICEVLSSLNCLLSLLCNWFSPLEQAKYLLLGLGITGRPVFQCLMCVERYLAVVHPVTFLKYKPLRYRVVCSVVAWIITIGSCICCMLTISSHIHFYMCFFSTQFLVFLFIQMFCLVAVLRALKQSGPGDRKKEEENHMKRRAFHLILITSVSMFITYAPFSLSGFIFIFSGLFIKELFYFNFACLAFAGFVQPILYLHRVGKIYCPCCS